ncbi:MAG TPA: hypothetical protein VGE21_15305 [Flavobacteriales bacterium]
MMSIRALFALALLAALDSFGQQASIYDDATRTLYSRENYGGPVLHGDGWGVQFFHGRYRTARDRHLLGVEIVGMKHPKEIKSFNPWYEDSRGYFYGKQNSMMIVRAIYGRKHRITEKIRKSGVELNYVWGFGPALGLLKPVYLQIGEPRDPPYTSIAVERYDPEVHFANNIYGRASWFRGLGEMEVRPGAHARLALNCEYAGDNTGIRALEAGATIDVFAEKVPIMAELNGVENKQFFLEFYIALQFGSKKIR